MATREGYVNGMARFYDHQPFYERLVDATREIDFLPKKSSYVVHTSAFLKMKKELASLTAKTKRTMMKGPTLTRHIPGCPQPRGISHKAGRNIDNLCGSTPTPKK